MNRIDSSGHSRVVSDANDQRDLPFACEIVGDQRARLAGEVDQDRARLREHDAVVVDHRDLSERVHRAELGGVELVRRVIDAFDLERQRHLFERPKYAEVAGVAAGDLVDASESIELEHAAGVAPR